MRKLWLRSVIVTDTKADVMFHYYQELPNYLIGHHKVSKEDAAMLGAFIYRSKYGDSDSKLSKIRWACLTYVQWKCRLANLCIAALQILPVQLYPFNI